MQQHLQQHPTESSSSWGRRKCLTGEKDYPPIVIIAGTHWSAATAASTRKWGEFLRLWYVQCAHAAALKWVVRCRVRHTLGVGERPFRTNFKNLRRYQNRLEKKNKTLVCLIAGDHHNYWLGKGLICMWFTCVYRRKKQQTKNGTEVTRWRRFLFGFGVVCHRDRGPKSITSEGVIDKQICLQLIAC